MSIDRAQGLTDVRTIFDGATGTVATLRDAGAIRWEGPFDAPNPSGDPDDPALALDVILAEVGAGGDSFGVQMVESFMELGVWVERKPGHDRLGLQVCQELEELFENQDTATMQFYPENAYISNDGTVGEFQFKALQLPYQRREALGESVMATVNQVLVNETAHGFSALQWLGRSAGSYVLAGAAEAVGIIAAVPNANQFLLQTDGPLTAAHGFADGPIFKHVSTDGDAQSAVPLANERFQRLGYASGGNTLIVRIEPEGGV
jgi:hypothetical protein